MQKPNAFCPKCKNDVNLIEEGDTKRCPLCGFRFEVSAPPPLFVEAKPRSLFAEIALQMLKALAVVAAIGLVLLGILFAGCAFIFRNV